MPRNWCILLNNCNDGGPFAHAMADYAEWQRGMAAWSFLNRARIRCQAAGTVETYYHFLKIGGRWCFGIINIVEMAYDTIELLQAFLDMLVEINYWLPERKHL